MESLQVFTGFIRQIIERSDFSVDVALVRKREIATAVSINENLSSFWTPFQPLTARDKFDGHCKQFFQ